MKPRQTTASVLTAVLLATTSCTASKQVDSWSAQVSDQLKGVDHYKKPDTVGLTGVTDQPILGLNMVRTTTAAGLPSNYAIKRFGWSLDRSVTLAEIASHITARTGLPTRVNERRPDLPMPLVNGAVDPNAVVTAGNVNSVFQGAFAGAGSGNAVGGRASMVPSYDGNLADFIRSLEPLFGVTAAYRDGALVFDGYQIISCTVPAAPTLSTLTSEVSGATQGAANGPTGSTASQSTTTQATLDVWNDIRNTLKTIVPAPDVAVASPALRQINAVVGYEGARRLRQYCDQLESAMAARISVTATIIELSVSNDDDYGLNLAPLWTAASGVQIGLEGIAPQIVGAPGAGSVTVLPPSKGGTSTHWAATQAVIRAASTAGKLAGVRNGTAVLQNGRSNTINLTTRQDYIKNLTFSQGSTVSAPTTATQTDSINYGFSMQILAHVSGRDHINIHSNVTVSDLAALVSQPLGDGGVVQLSTVPNRAFDADIDLANGETLVIAGNEQMRVRRDQTGIITPEFFGLGGAQKSTVETTRLMLFLTAQRLQEPGKSPAAPQAFP